MLIDRTLHVLYHEVEFQKSELAIINAWSLRSVVNYYNESIEKKYVWIQRASMSICCQAECRRRWCIRSFNECFKQGCVSHWGRERCSLLYLIPASLKSAWRISNIARRLRFFITSAFVRNLMAHCTIYRPLHNFMPPPPPPFLVFFSKIFFLIVLAYLLAVSLIFFQFNFLI